MKFFLIVFILLYSKYLPCQENIAAWTFMVYLAADNNLEEWAIKDFLEMAEIGSKEKEVNIVVQFDRYAKGTTSFGNWKETLRFHIRKGMEPTTSNATSILKEINMADKEELYKFIIWAKNNYPAQKYALILWDHGNGWYYRYHKKDLSKALIIDDEARDIMDLDELKEALSGLDFKLNIIGFDMCLMGMIEVAYQIKDYAKYMVASANIEEAFGWHYDKFLERLNKNPRMSDKELAENIVNTYKKYYYLYSRWQYFTLSAIDLTQITALAEAIDSLARELMKLRKDKITKARENCIEYEEKKHIDLYNFIEKLDIEEAIKNNIKDKFKNCVIVNVSGEKIINSGGLAIYFPKDYYDPSYSKLVYSKQSLWDDFLRYYLSKEPKILVYPNPCLSNKIIFELDVKPKSIKIYDISGNLIKILKDYKEENKIYKFIWELPPYITGGIYIYYLEGDISWGHLFIIR